MSISGFIEQRRRKRKRPCHKHCEYCDGRGVSWSRGRTKLTWLNITILYTCEIVTHLNGDPSMLLCQSSMVLYYAF